jgi:hypothetical protein
MELSLAHARTAPGGHFPIVYIINYGRPKWERAALKGPIVIDHAAFNRFIYPKNAVVI